MKDLPQTIPMLSYSRMHRNIVEVSGQKESIIACKVIAHAGEVYSSSLEVQSVLSAPNFLFAFCVVTSRALGNVMFAKTKQNIVIQAFEHEGCTYGFVAFPVLLLMLVMVRVLALCATCCLLNITAEIGGVASRERFCFIFFLCKSLLCTLFNHHLQELSTDQVSRYSLTKKLTEMSAHSVHIAFGENLGLVVQQTLSLSANSRGSRGP